MKQPDRFAEVVEKNASGPPERRFLFPNDAAILLRHEHSAMVRAVKKMMRDQTKWESHYLEACHDMLALLAQRRKGTK